MLALVLVAAFSETLINGFVDAMNKGGESLATHLKANGSGGVATPEFSERVDRMTRPDVPFKVVKVTENTPVLVRARVENKRGEPLGLSLVLDGKNPPKIIGVRLQDVESLDYPLPKDYTNWTSVKDLVRSIRTDTKSPALILGVARANQPIEIVVDGVRKLGVDAPAQGDDLWHIGSITKSMTATLIARLIEKKRLRWDTTLAALLPDFQLTDQQKKITVHQLMRHRSGLPRDLGFNRTQVEEIVGSEKDPVKVRERYIKDVLSRPLLHDAGTAFAYSNAGYTLLGFIAERIEKVPYEKLIKREVFDPLGMNRTFVGPAGVPDDRTRGHLTGNPPTAHEVDEDLQRMLVPAGNVWMSVQDLLTYGKAHMAGLRGKDGFLSAATIRKLHEALPEDEGDMGGYASGWVVGPLQGTALRHGHNGSNGTFVAELAIFPDQELVIASISNRGYPVEPSPALQAVLAVARKLAPAKR